MSFKRINKLIPVIVVILFAASCKKDEDRAVYNPAGTGFLLASSSSSLVLDSNENANTATAFTWPAVSFGFDADVTYTLQFGQASDSFKTPTSVVIGHNVLSKSYTVEDLNKIAYQNLALPANNAGDVIVRIKADVNQNGPSGNGSPSSIASVYSDTVHLSITPYKIIIVYPTLWVPGDYQGWTPATAPTVASVKSNSVYEGYINFPAGGTLQFKITPAATWDNSYGWLSSKNDTVGSNVNVTGTMSLTGGGNLFVPASGYYLIKADLNTNPANWSASPTQWGIVGDATPKGWDASTPMTYDAASGTWSVTADLTVALLKFRANDAWDLNFGDDGADGTLDYNGANINIKEAGNYTITLDLSSSGNYTYSLKKN